MRSPPLWMGDVAVTKHITTLFRRASSAPPVNRTRSLNPFRSGKKVAS
jgi:hypothetical protein